MTALGSEADNIMEMIRSLGRGWARYLPICQPSSQHTWLRIHGAVLHFQGPLCLVRRGQGVQVLRGYMTRLTDPGHE